MTRPASEPSCNPAIATSQASAPRRVFLLAIAVLSLTGCGFFAKKPAPPPGNPLAVANCPVDLPALADDTFGGANRKIVEIAGIYHQCAIAARGAK